MIKACVQNRQAISHVNGREAGGFANEGCAHVPRGPGARGRPARRRAARAGAPRTPHVVVAEARAKRRSMQRV